MKNLLWSDRNRPLLLTLGMLSVLLFGCAEQRNIGSLAELQAAEFAVPTGTVADQLVLSRLPDASFIYFNSVLDAAMAVKAGKADAVAYDEPILRNIAAKSGGLRILDEMITTDSYGMATRKEAPEIKKAIDTVLEELRRTGIYEEMLARWFPESGAPAAMPEIELDDTAPVLRLGTAAVTEPFSFVGNGREITGFDIELARRVAARMGRRLEVVNLEFGALIPALRAGKVDLIAACITITEERGEQVLFSEPYYAGGIAAMVRE
jgi:polar amino acid transport system substrate-binding protein